MHIQKEGNFERKQSDVLMACICLFRQQRNLVSTELVGIIDLLPATCLDELIKGRGGTSTEPDGQKKQAVFTCVCPRWKRAEPCKGWKRST